MIRTIRPTDLVALVTFEGRALPNAARARHALSQEHQRPLPVSAILEQWLPFEGRRYTWVAVHSFSIHGLISAQHRAGRSAWEVDWLIVDSLDHAEDVARHLLDRLSAEGGEAGAQKVFLRLPTDSFLVNVARQAGFWPYLSETLYRWAPQKRPAVPVGAVSPPIASLRRKTKADDYGIFRLYNLAVPESVRRAQGVTFADWREARELSPGRKQELVSVQEGKVRTWLGLAQSSQAGMFDLMLDPAEAGATEALVQYALRQLGPRAPVLCLVPEYHRALRRVLEEDEEARPVAEYITMVKVLTVRVPAQGLVPAQA
ncbi:MAG: hypothetical protein HY689_11905 [Chloroflexi bacterium]|nr:hypothetical protein [Chloroflexota bacterium]